MKSFKEYNNMSEQVIRSEKIGDLSHELHKTPWGYQVRIFHPDGTLYHSDVTKNSEDKGHKSFDSSVAYTKKMMRIK